MPTEINQALLSKDRYQHFISLYRQVKQEGLESHTFNHLFRELYQHQVVTPFRYTNWQDARSAWMDPEHDFNALSLTELQQHLHALFYADRFEEGTIVSAYNSGVFEKIFNSMEQQLHTLSN